MLASSTGISKAFPQGSRDFRRELVGTIIQFGALMRVRMATDMVSSVLAITQPALALMKIHTLNGRTFRPASVQAY